MQACFLGDVRVIWCNSLGDSHFKIYVMNNVENCNWLLFTYHLTCCHAVTSCTHYTSYSLLNLVHEIVCEFSLVIQDYVFYGVWCKICLRVDKNCVFDDWKSCFWSSGEKKMFLKNF